MNELQAAYGLLQLKYVDSYIRSRKTIVETYREKLSGISGLRFLNNPEEIEQTYTYFPILIDSDNYGKSRDYVYESLKKYNIYSRRYFYPLISNFPTYKGLQSSKKENLPVANRIADEVICLPVFPDLSIENVQKICRILKEKSY